MGAGVFGLEGKVNNKSPNQCWKPINRQQHIFLDWIQSISASTSKLSSHTRTGALLVCCLLHITQEEGEEPH